MTPPPTLTLGRRIAVVGCSGSGKTTVAQRLAHALDIPYICNDALIWRPDWTPATPEQQLAGFDAATTAPAWTLDGNLNPDQPAGRLVLARIDTLLWLDLPRRQVWPQLLARTLRRAWTGQELWHGNRETFRTSFASRDSILLWSVRSYPGIRRRYAALFADPAHAHLIRLRLHRRRDADRLIRRAYAATQAASSISADTMTDRPSAGARSCVFQARSST